MIKSLFVLLVLFIFGFQLSQAQITQDATSTAAGAGVTTRTWAHTCSGANRILLVGVTTQDGKTCTATYNGVAMTQAATVSPKMRVTLFYMVNPPAGNFNITVTLATAGDVAAGAVSYNGVDPSNPFGTFVTTNAKSTTPSATVASATGDLAFAYLGSIASNPTPHVSQTEAFERRNTMTAEASTEAGAASVPMTYTLNVNEDWAIIGVSLHSAVPLPTTEVTLNAKTKGPKKVELSWKSTEELPQDFYRLYRSADGQNYEEIYLEMNRRGKSQLYYYTDNTAQPGTNYYYRVLQTDGDSRQVYSNVAEVVPDLWAIQSLSPNPVRTQLTVALASPGQATATYQLVDDLGRTVYSSVLQLQPGTTILSLDVQTLATGLYLFRIQKDGESWLQKQFVVN